MADAAANWMYADNVPTQRQTALMAVSTFEELAEQALTEISRIRARVDPGRDPGLTHCLQPVFSFELPTVGDRLFNGAYGYRAQYWRAPFEGLKANALLIQLLTPKLLAMIDEKAEPNFAKIDACASLRVVFGQILDTGDSIAVSKPNRRLERGALVRGSGDGDRGWSAVMKEHREHGLSKSDVVKIPHHGSLNAHYEPMWNDGLHRSPISVVAPFGRGRKSTRPPTSDDIERITGLSSRTYLTSPVAGAPALRFEPAVERTLAEGGIQIVDAASPLGVVRVRRVDGSWKETLFSPAAELRRR